MSNRPAGGARSQKWEKSDYDFYREKPIVIEQLMATVDFGDDLIWDGCCGTGNVLNVAKARGHPTIGSDIIDRHCLHPFYRSNILKATRWPKSPDGRALSYISNPPYSYEEDIAERIMRHVTGAFPVRRAAFIVPIAFLASAGRYQFFAKDCRPSHVGIYSERHTMPPGELFDTLSGKGGMADYCAIIFTAGGPWRTETLWFPPGPVTPKSERRISRGSPTPSVSA